MKKIEDYLHLYLPFEFEWIEDAVSFNKGERGIMTADDLKYWDEYKMPILRPLSAMTNAEGYELCQFLNWRCDTNFLEDIIKYGVSGIDATVEKQAEFMRILLSMKFDLFGLIESGLALPRSIVDAPIK